MTKKLLGILLTVTLGCHAAFADTIHMKNGIQITGVVEEQTGERVKVRIGKRTTTLRASEIRRIDKNEKTGVFDRKKAEEAARLRNLELQQETGLTAAERTEVRKALDMLILPKASDRERGIAKLVALAKRMNVFRYLEHSLPSMLPYHVPGVLQAMARIDPERTKPHVRSEVFNVDTKARAAALILIGELRDWDSSPMLLRGLKDHRPEVRCAAAQALGTLRVREATPALIESLPSPDVRCQNAMRSALKSIWSSEEHAVSFSTISEWQTFWAQNKSSVSSTFQLASVTPLVAPGTEFENE